MNQTNVFFIKIIVSFSPDNILFFFPCALNHNTTLVVTKEMETKTDNINVISFSLIFHLLSFLSLRYLLPGLCHLSAEEGPRKVLLTLDTPALLVDFLSQSWTSLKGKSGVASARDPSMETVCSALLNFTVTEPERVR